MNKKEREEEERRERRREGGGRKEGKEKGEKEKEEKRTRERGGRGELCTLMRHTKTLLLPNTQCGRAQNILPALYETDIIIFSWPPFLFFFPSGSFFNNKFHPTTRRNLN